MDGGLRTVTDLIALLSMLMSPLPGCDCFRVSQAEEPAVTPITPG